MKLLRLFFIIFFIIFSNQIKAEEEDLKNKITKNLRCLICQGQSIYDSDSQFAISLKILVKTVPDYAKNDDVDEIIAYLKTTIKDTDSSLIHEWEKLQNLDSGESLQEKAKPTKIASDDINFSISIK